MKKLAAALTVYVETPTGTGSGFFFNRNAWKDTESPDYVVLTNRHVVGNYANVEVCWSIINSCVTGKVTDKAENLDVAVIEHDSFLLNMVLVHAYVPEIDSFGWGGNWDAGDVVYASGYPGGNKAKGTTTISEPIVTEGIITRSTSTRYTGGRFIEHGADVGAGSSGGPLMNNDGYIVGMNAGSNTEAERLEVAVPVGYVINWLKTGEEPGSTSRPSPGPTDTPKPTPIQGSTPTPAFGSRGNPVPLNHTVVYPDWEISVISFDRNANSEIAAENRFNDPPEPGHVYVLARVQAKYIGSSIGTASRDLRFYLVGNSNVFYEKAWIVTPDVLSNQPDALPGGTVTGNVQFMVPANEVDSLLLVVSDGIPRYADTIGYFSLR